MFGQTGGILFAVLISVTDLQRRLCVWVVRCMSIHDGTFMNA